MAYHTTPQHTMSPQYHVTCLCGGGWGGLGRAWIRTFRRHFPSRRKTCLYHGTDTKHRIQQLLLLLLSRSVVSDSVRPHRRQPTRLPCPWDSPGKNTGVGCHFLLQCMKVKSESELTQLCPTLHDPMDCSPPGSSIHGIFQARVLEWGAIASSKMIYNITIFI